MRTIKLILATLLFGASFAHSQDLDGMTTTGMAAYTELKRPFYVAALYSDKAVVDAESFLTTQGRRRMGIRVNGTRLTPRRFSSQWTQALLINVSPEQLDRFDDAFVQFNNLPKETFKVGDQIVIDSFPEGATVVSVNGTIMLSVARNGFFELLVSKWIGDRPPSSDFKADILNPTIDPTLQAEFNSLEPTDARIAEVKAWIADEEAEAELMAKEAAAAAAVLIASEAASVAEKTAAEKSVAEAMAKRVEKERIAAETAKLEAEEGAAEQQMDPAMYKLQQDTLLKLYRSSVVKHTLKEVVYPKRAIKRNRQGTVILDVTVSRAGQIMSITAVKEAKYSSLNDAAIDAVNKVEKYSAVPAGLDGESITINVPVKFILN
ncbi:MAG: protein TonB [Pseudomonadales bacterium]|jgi:protein TonB